MFREWRRRRRNAKAAKMLEEYWAKHPERRDEFTKWLTAYYAAQMKALKALRAQAEKRGR